MWPTISVSFWITGAAAASSLGSLFCVTSTGAWPSLEYVPAANSPLSAVTDTEEAGEPIVRPANEVKSRRTCRVAVPPPQGFPGRVNHVGTLGLVPAGAAAWAAPPAAETCAGPATGKKPLGRLTVNLALPASEQSRSKSTW